ncbi:TetR family transcriptional regulator [Glycomyces buryatensis]|uniref:TetR family transcriptional regulator n=1 Tax=Glycomyces buryatensis TaxID=2570927 RepID=A0A4S8PUF4_9ACTN|nr:TetR family transcriptional regulator [Glycomyces buryatensis]THV33515.1 TetR family transcriptional regulator [Glycomyces buryatensis]
MEDVRGLRERKKAATKSALSQAALRLAMEKGSLDAVTADAIAAEAGVSTRTFHNYFPSKEEAFLYDFNELTGLLLAGLRERVAHQRVWDAFRDSCIALDLDNRFDLTQMQCREELIHNSPQLIKYQAGQFMELFKEALGIVADATGTDPQDMLPKLLLGNALIAMKTANEHWIANPAGRTLAEAITEAFALIDQGITGPTTTSHS